MDWPRRSIEHTPRDRFKPPHCPWPECGQHHAHPDLPFRYKRDGSYPRLCDNRRVQRFLCKACGRGFSTQTFTCTYYAKLPHLLPHAAAALNAGSAHRQIARSFGCSPSTITRIAARLGRHALLLQAFALNHLSGIDEPIVLDHFESFVWSQFDALGLATPVGHESWFVFGVDPAPHRRGGRLSAAQKRKLEKRTRPLAPRGSVRDSFSRVFDLIQSLLGPEDRWTLISDAHPAGRAALAGHPLRKRTRHRVFPNPPRGSKGSPRSPAARARDEAMFPVDALHALWRHSHAHQRRETIAFARRINAAAERGFLMVVWRNFVKWRSERRPDRRTPAMVKGLSDEPWSWARVLAQRLFPSRIRVPFIAPLARNARVPNMMKWPSLSPAGIRYMNGQ